MTSSCSPCPLGAYLDLDKPIRVTISPWRRIDDNVIPPRAKVTGLYINSALATSQAKELGFDEAIMLNGDGSVSEGPGENIFMMRDGKLITTGPDSNILEGITRHAVMTLAREEFGIEVVERRVARTELYIADELFFTGTAAQISAIGEVDGRVIGSGEIGPVTAPVAKGLLRGSAQPQSEVWRLVRSRLSGRRQRVGVRPAFQRIGAMAEVPQFIGVL